MGVGKTTIGNLVAQKLNWEFIDIDEYIEKEFNLPVSQIFAKFGEQVFRDKEKEVIKRLSEQPQKILSLGGGAFLQEEIRQECLKNCIVIYLDLSLEAWKERLALIIESRPVLKGKSINEMEELFYQRQAVYSDHHLKIATDHKSVEGISAEILDALGTVLK
ncbi:shikimate kinase [Neobacillus jeddahensis]|uniref:shikimate kinase n=1 Tax=Neobacillus jeddahensis TaxID=1461580 RepID=UPI0005A71B05|nr:shikimate kinase [Neobacillus jeddahensis]